MCHAITGRRVMQSAARGGILSLARRQQIGDGVHGGYSPLVDGEIAGSAATDL
jgi:hypothetical protein